MYLQKNFFVVKNRRGVFVSSFKVRRLAILVCSTAFLLALFLFSSGFAEAIEKSGGDFVDNSNSSILSTHDKDGDGISDTDEDMLGTNKSDKYGDKDNDGLYDFEEYLDYYGTPNITSDTPKYNYDDNDSRVTGLLDIYDRFGLDSNKDGYLRDTVFTEQNGGFTNYLLWNVTFDGTYAGGSERQSVTYSNNVLDTVTFSGDAAGGSSSGVVTYNNNVLDTVTFGGVRAGGSWFSGITYSNNVLDAVTFSGSYAGGNVQGGAVSHSDNTFTNVAFSGTYAGGSSGNSAVSHSDNTFTNVSFSGENAGGSVGGAVSHSRNTFTNVSFSGKGAGGSSSGVVTYLDNTLSNTTFSGWNAGGSGMNSLTYEDNNFADVHFLKTEISTDNEYGDSGISINGSTLYKSNTFERVQFAQFVAGRADYALTVVGNTMVAGSDAYDSDLDGVRDIFEFLNGYDLFLADRDNDGLSDKWELEYGTAAGVNRDDTANAAELSSDKDRDGLSLLQEAQLNTNPGDSDTDGDLLPDGWEFRYRTAAGVNLTDAASRAELSNDEDGDGLSLLQEAQLNTSPSDSDTDGDLLPDGWEFKYRATDGVSPADAATKAELSNDTDGDGLNISEEARLNTNPSDSDTDGDLLPDGWEFRYRAANGVNLTVAANAAALYIDEDGDGLSLLQEAQLNTSPLDFDTDGDLLPDGWEFRYMIIDGINPTVAATDAVLSSDEDDDGLSLLREALFNTHPSDPDTDDDFLPDGWEFRYMTVDGVDPVIVATDAVLSSDEDGDGLSLLREAQLNTNPSDSDTDGDGIPDDVEIDLMLDPTNASTDGVTNDGLLDADYDGLFNRLEIQLGSNPNNNDSDGDGFPDGYEYSSGLSILENDAGGDLDEDNLNNSYEYILGLLVNNSDTDDDGLPDGYEVLNNLNANFAGDASSDKDGDGWTNLEEFMEDTDPCDLLSYPSESLGQSLFHLVNNNIYDTGIRRDTFVPIAVVLVLMFALLLIFVFYKVFVGGGSLGDKAVNTNKQSLDLDTKRLEINYSNTSLIEESVELLDVRPLRYEQAVEQLSKIQKQRPGLSSLRQSLATNIAEVQSEVDRLKLLLAEAIREAELKRAAEEKARQEAEAKLKAERAAEDKAKKEAEAKLKAEDKAKKEAEAKLKAEDKAKKEAEAKLKAEDKAKKEAEAKLKAEDKAKKEAEAKLKAEDKAKKEAEAKLKAEDKAKKEAEAKPKPKKEVEAKPKPKKEAKAKPKPKKEAKAKPKPKKEAKAKPKPKKEAKAKPKPKKEAKAKPKAEEKTKKE